MQDSMRGVLADASLPDGLLMCAWQRVVAGSQELQRQLQQCMCAALDASVTPAVLAQGHRDVLANPNQGSSLCRLPLGNAPR